MGDIGGDIQEYHSVSFCRDAGGPDQRFALFGFYSLGGRVCCNGIEYGLFAAGIALAIIAVVNGLGADLNTVFYLGQYLAESLIKAASVG